MTTAPETFHTAHGETIVLEPGANIIVGWSARQGDRGPGATHDTESVVALTADGLAVILTGGEYDETSPWFVVVAGRPCRILKLYRADGSPTTQIRGRV